MKLFVSELKTPSMRSAFTLIEVLVATIIASIAGMALLQMNANNTHLFKQIQYRSSNSEMLSLIALHNDVKYNKTTKTLDDILDNTYTIANDDLRKYLKETRIDYNEKVIELITFGASEEETPDVSMADQETTMAQDEQMSGVAPVIQFELVQIIVKNDEGKNAILTARSFQ